MSGFGYVGDTQAIAGDLVLILVALLLGSAVLTALRVRTEGRLERALFGIGIGLWLIEYVPMLLGAFDMLTPRSVRIAWLAMPAGGVLLNLAARRAAGKPRRPDRALAARAESVVPGGESLAAMRAAVRPIVVASCLVIVSAAAIVLAGAFQHDAAFDYDAAAYHLAAPRYWLETGNIRPAPTMVHTEWPMGAEMLYTLMLPIGGFSACKLLAGAFALLSAAAVFVLGRRWMNWQAGLFAAALYVALMQRAAEINTIKVESAWAFAATLAALALLAWYRTQETSGRKRWLLLAAIFAGWCCCIKLNGLLTLFALACAAASLSTPDGRTPGDADARDEDGRAAAWRSGLAAFCAVVVVGIACAAPWYVRSWIHIGNPVFPFGYGLLGGRGWNARAAANLAEYLHTYGIPGRTVAIRQALATRRLVFRLALLAVAVAALPRSRQARIIVATAGCAAVFQAWSSDQFRFQLPVAAVACAFVAAYAVRFAARRPAAGWAALLLFPFILYHHNVTTQWKMALGGERPVPKSDVVVDVSSWVNLHLPPGPVLVGPDTRRLLLNREAYLSDSLFQQEIPTGTRASFRAALNRLGVRYAILWDWRPRAFQFEAAAGWRAAEHDRLTELARESRLVARFPAVSIYRIAPPALTAVHAHRAMTVRYPGARTGTSVEPHVRGLPGSRAHRRAPAGFGRPS